MAQEVVKFIRKANDLVEAKYKFDIWETRIFSKMLTMIHRDDEDFKEYRIYLRDIVQEFGLVKTRDAYEWLRAGAKNLMKKTFLIPYELDGAKRSFETPVVSSLDSAVADDKKIRQDHLYISISFHPKMKPYLLQLKSQFTIYDVQNIVKLPSTYSIESRVIRPCSIGTKSAGSEANPFTPVGSSTRTWARPTAVGSSTLVART